MDMQESKFTLCSFGSFSENLGIVNCHKQCTESHDNPKFCFQPWIRMKLVFLPSKSESGTLNLGGMENFISGV